MYSDESRFGVFSDRRTVTVWRVDDRYVQDMWRHVMVWGGIFSVGVQSYSYA
jgi:hypothetical protein